MPKAKKVRIEVTAAEALRLRSLLLGDMARVEDETLYLLCESVVEQIERQSPVEPPA